jgi:hypothetical protein
MADKKKVTRKKPTKSAVQRREEKAKVKEQPIEEPIPETPAEATELPDESIEEIIGRLSYEIQQTQDGTMEVTECMRVLTWITEQIEKRKFDTITGDDLTRLLAKLTTLNVNIGIMASEAMFAANMSYGYRTMQYAADWNPTKERLGFGSTKAPTIEDIRNELLVKQWDAKAEEMQKKLAADRMVAINKGIDSVVQALGHRLRLVMQDRATTRYQNQ